MPQVWSQVESSVAVLGTVDAPRLPAVLIDEERGLFIAHQSALLSPGSQTAVLNRRIIVLTPVSVDEKTQIALLKAIEWQKGLGKAVSLASATGDPGDDLLAATQIGPVKAKLLNDSRPGQMRPSLRYAPLAEVELEEGRAPVTGAMAFNDQGELVGVISSALAANVRGSQGVAPNALESPRRFGPGGLTVGYAIGPALLGRVVKGFLRDDHKVQHPSIGIFFKAGGSGGALIEAVLPESPGQAAGLQVGDVIIDADETKITSPIDLAVLLFAKEPGEELIINVRRGVEEYAFRLIVGVDKQPKPRSAEHQPVSTGMSLGPSIG